MSDRDDPQGGRGGGNADGDAEEGALEAFAERTDWEAWKAPLPPADFAQHVVQRAYPRQAAERSASRAARRALQLGAATAALLLSVVLWIALDRRTEEGASRATERTQIAIGRRAVAVLEPGAALHWQGDRVSQSGGDVFYRVEPGGLFSVTVFSGTTPVGSIEVLGTCFRIRVEPAEAGAPAGVTTLVRVYEGRVRALAADASLELGPGEQARLGASGVQRLFESSADARGGLDAPGTPNGTAPSAPANATSPDALAADVVRSRTELEGLKREQAALDARVARARERLAQAGGAPERHRYDLTTEDWKELATKGTVKFRLPCARSDYAPSAALLDRLGLMPEDAELLQRAYTASRERVWRRVFPLCTAALGSEDLAEQLEREACTMAILQLERRRDRAGSDEAMRRVGEIRAGLRPAPAPGEPLHPVLDLFLALTAEPLAFEAELSQSLGPEDAKRIAFSDDLCHERLTLDGPDQWEE